MTCARTDTRNGSLASCSAVLLPRPFHRAPPLPSLTHSRHRTIRNPQLLAAWLLRPRPRREGVPPLPGGHGGARHRVAVGGRLGPAHAPPRVGPRGERAAAGELPRDVRGRRGEGDGGGRGLPVPEGPGACDCVHCVIIFLLFPAGQPCPESPLFLCTMRFPCSISRTTPSLHPRSLCGLV